MTALRGKAKGALPGLAAAAPADLDRGAPAPHLRPAAIREPAAMRLTSPALAVLLALEAGPAAAQFTGPAETGADSTVAAAVQSLPGSRVALTGSIVAHLGEDYYIFRDETGEIRVEIEHGVWRGRPVGPETRLRIAGEVDGLPGRRYVWVETLDILP
jgi:uncharacterized protein (TIGR00156 family)